LEDIQLSQTQAKITNKALDKLSASKSLLSLNLKGISQTQGFEEQLATFLFKKAVIKKPLQKLSVASLAQAGTVFAKNIELPAIEEEKNENFNSQRGYYMNVENSTYAIGGNLVLLNQYNHLKLKNTTFTKALIVNVST